MLLNSIDKMIVLLDIKKMNLIIYFTYETKMNLKRGKKGYGRHLFSKTQ